MFNLVETNIENAKLFDPQYKIKLGRLQRYVKSLGRKLMAEINAHGLYENAGQLEIGLAFDRMRKYNLDAAASNVTYYLEKTIRNYFNMIGEDCILDEDWTIL